MRVVALVFLAACATSHVGPAPLSPQPSVGALEGFRDLYVDPKTFTNTLQDPESKASADLPIDNIANARAVVTINGTEVGLVPPFGIAVVHGVPVGAYEVRFRVPNGYERVVEIQTADGPVTSHTP